MKRPLPGDKTMHHNTPQYRLALVKADDFIRDMVHLAQKYDLPTLFPEVKILGIADTRLEPDLAQVITSAGIRIFDHYQDMLAQIPDINTIIFLKNGPEFAHDLRRNLSPSISIIDSQTASYLWQTLVQEKLCLSCQTNLSHTQNMLQTIINEMHEDILILDRDKIILDANKNVSQRLGLSKTDILGRPCWSTWDKASQSCKEANLHCPFETVLRTGRKAEALHSRTDSQGHLQYFRIYIYPVKDNEGRITHLLEMRRDITERTFLEKKLQQSEKMAAIGELSTYIAHEIRNPLFAIGGFANSLLKMPELSKKAQKKAGIILDESKRLDEILKSILNFARPTKTDISEVEVHQIIKETMNLLGIGCKKQKIQVTLELKPGLPMAKADPGLIKQGLINIIKNAIECMPDGGQLRIKTFMEEKMLCLQIKDTGPGIPPEHLVKIFNPFFSTKKKGSGLGLAMTKKIIEDIGGRLELKSKVGQGTTVSIYLPPVLALKDKNTKNISIR